MSDLIRPVNDVIKTASHQVSWWDVITWAQQQAARHGIDIVGDHLPLPGTPSWCGLPDDDARKLCAVLLAGARDALNAEGRQELMAAASKAVAASADWPKVAQEIRQLADARRTGIHIPRAVAR